MILGVPQPLPSTAPPGTSQISPGPQLPHQREEGEEAEK